jgi:hypothetical protein
MPAPDASGSDTSLAPDTLAAAGDIGPGGGPPPADASDAGAEPARQDAAPPVMTGPFRDVDLLFLVDNSPSMREEQDALVRNFPALIDELKKVPGGLPNLHVGVVTSDLGAGAKPLSNGGCPRIGGDRGIFQAPTRCQLSSASFLVSDQNGTHNNFPGDISAAFGCIASVGAMGCGYEHQLQATRVALYEAITPENRGFLRENALLAIVIVSDEDDCSASTDSTLFTDDAAFPGTSASFRCAQVGHWCDGKAPPIAPFDVPLATCTAAESTRLINVNEVVGSIRALKRVPDREIFVAGLFGWPNDATTARYRYADPRLTGGLDYLPICNSTTNGEATAALRLKKFVESFGANGTFFTICQDDLSVPFRQIAQRLARLVSP